MDATHDYSKSQNCSSWNGAQMLKTQLEIHGRRTYMLKKLTLGFKTTGAAYPDSIELLLLLNSKGDWPLLCERVVHDNLLKKKSNRWIGHLVQYFQKRYVNEHESLPNAKSLSLFVSKVKSPSARVQALYQYICESDAFVDAFVLDLIAPKLAHRALGN
jgi:hypothetical protein